MGSQDSHHPHPKHSANDEHWIMEIKHALLRRDEMHQSAMSMPCPSIFMAPAPLRGLKHQAFIPQVVPIGPYHCDIGPHHSSFPMNPESKRYKDIAAKEMEKHKIMASKYVEKGFKEGLTIFSLADRFKKMIKQVKQEYDSDRACNQSDERLAFMLALDASFVVEVLRCNAAEANLQEKRPWRVASTLMQQQSTKSIRRTQQGYSLRQDSGSILQQADMAMESFNAYYCNRFPLPLRKSILQDFVMLENQIPLFCLLEVIQMGRGCESKAAAGKILGPLFLQIALEVLPFYLQKEEKLEFIQEHVERRKHLLDCLYAIVTHAIAPTTKGDLVLKPTHFPRAVELHDSGISFASFKPVESGNLLKVWFDPKRAILHAPRVRVGDETERLLRNLIAYESHIIDNVHVLSYLRFMNNLVDDADDVALLVKKGIITEDIGSDAEVADMWNNLCVNTMRVCSEPYEEVARELVMHCGRKLNSWKAELKRTYFSRPWLLLSLFSGFALLVMTLIIMLYTILLYHKP